MTLDLKAADYTLSGLRPFPVAITTVYEGRANGLMSLSAGAAAANQWRRSRIAHTSRQVMDLTVVLTA